MSRRKLERRDDLTEGEAAFLAGENRPEDASQWEWLALSWGGDAERPQICPWFRPGRPTVDALWAMRGPEFLEKWEETGAGAEHPLLARYGDPRKVPGSNS